MKKIFSILLFIVLIFSLSACNKSNNTSSELDTSTQSDVSSISTSSQNNTTSNKNSESEQSSSEEEIKPQSSSESSSNAEESEPYDNKTTVIAGEYAVTFDYGYDNIKTTAKSKNYKVAKPAEPIRSGYKFMGWYAENESEQWNFAGHMVSEDMTLTAKWIQKIEVEAENYNHTGLMIVDISKDSDLYGKAQNDDIITQVNGIDITDDKILLDIIKERKPGDKISLTIISTDETQKTIEVKLIANTDNSLARLGIAYSVIDSVTDKTSNNGFDFPFGE